MRVAADAVTTPNVVCELRSIGNNRLVKFANLCHDNGGSLNLMNRIDDSSTVHLQEEFDTKICKQVVPDVTVNINRCGASAPCGF